MGDDMAALLLTLAAENAELREQLSAAQDMLVETAIDAGHLHARIEAVQIEPDTWWAERLRPQLSADGRAGQATRQKLAPKRLDGRTKN